MAIYLVSYDLHRETNDERLEERIREHGEAVRVLLSQFVVRTDLSAAALVVDLQNFLDSDDRLLVNELTDNTAWYNLRASDDLMEKWRVACRA